MQKKDIHGNVLHVDNHAGNYVAPDTGVFAIIPTSWIPYAELMRIDRSAGYYAFYWHYAIGVAFAACIISPVIEVSEVLLLAAYLAVWVFIFRGITCTWNDILDQDVDRKVARTRFRPIARGAKSTFEGLIFTAVQLVVGTVMLVPFPPATLFYATIMTLILFIYPLGKRITHYPQMILGVGFAVPVFMCCAAMGVDVLGPQDLGTRRVGSGAATGASCLYGAEFLWTVIYDTVYAHQDIEDDIKAGVKSFAVRLGDNTKPVLAFLSLVQVALLAAAGVWCNLGIVYFVISVGGAASALTAMLVIVNLERPESCAWWFGPGSRLVGASIVTGLVGHYILRHF